MYIDRFMLASADDEREYFFTGGATQDRISPQESTLPFGIFPRLFLDKIEFSDITVFCGGSNTAKTLLLRLIAAKLGVEKAMSYKTKCFDDYCRLSTFKYSDFSNKNFESKIITRSHNEEYTAKRYEALDKEGVWSIVQLYEDVIRQSALYFLEEPDNGMSLSEQTELSHILRDAVKYYGAQFVITTNSPVLLGIKNALNYDFDATPILPRTWHDSPYSREFHRFCNELTESHTRHRSEKNKS